MALFDPKDLFRPLGALAAMAGSAAVGFVAGYTIGRDPDAARRLVGFFARSVDRAELAVAETREQLGDLWAEARSIARAESEDTRFAQHQAEVAETQKAKGKPSAAARKRARSTGTARRPRRARSPVVH